jgi:hypothetical protein
MKIEKCPFCGKEVAEISNCQELEGCRHFESCPATEPYVCVVCNMHEGGCGASSGYYDSEAKAIAAWNRRAQPENEPLVRCGEWRQRVNGNPLHGYECSACHGKCKNVYFRYCQNCGAEMREWEDG